MSGGKTRRETTIGHETCLLGFGGRDSVDSGVFDSTTLSAGGTDEVQTVTITGSPSGGTFKLTFNGGQVPATPATQQTAALAFNADGAAVQAALRLLSRVGTGVTVTGAAGGPYVVTFTGRLGGRDIPLLTAQPSLTGGTAPSVAVAETTKGSSKNRGLYVIESGLILAKRADGKRVIEYTGAGNINEIQTVTISGVPSGGTFTLTFEGEQTAAIAFNATAAAVQTALENLPNLDPGDIAVTGGPGPGTPYVVTFTGRRGGQSVQLLLAAHAFTGGTTPAIAVAQTTQGSEVQTIVGIFDGRHEFLDNSGVDDTAIPVYNTDCVFDKAKVKNFTLYEGALRRWASSRGCVFKSQGV